jgi:hypothetical protein
MYLRISGGILNTGVSLGASFFDLNIAAAWPYWYVGCTKIVNHYSAPNRPKLSILLMRHIISGYPAFQILKRTTT